MNDGDERLLVKQAKSVDEVTARGDLQARRIFTENNVHFESSLTFALYNRVPAGGANERHVHDNVEKIYYFLQGSGEVDCGPWTKKVAAGDFLFFPAAIEHEIRADSNQDLEFVVCGAKTVVEPRGMA
jgi:mannose-6-phosphate isomerase-like protein (cupin superfamily)